MPHYAWDFWWWHSFMGYDEPDWYKHRIVVWSPPGDPVDQQWDRYYFAVYMEKKRWWRALLANLHPMD